MYATIHEFRCPADAEPGIREVVAGCLPTGADPAGLSRSPTSGTRAAARPSRSGPTSRPPTAGSTG